MAFIIATEGFSPEIWEAALNTTMSGSAGFEMLFGNNFNPNTGGRIVQGGSVVVNRRNRVALHDLNTEAIVSGTATGTRTIAGTTATIVNIDQGKYFDEFISIEQQHEVVDELELASATMEEAGISIFEARNNYLRDKILNTAGIPRVTNSDPLLLIAGMSEHLNNVGTPDIGRVLLVSPAVEAQLIAQGILTIDGNLGGQIDNYIGDAFGFSIYRSNQLGGVSAIGGHSHGGEFVRHISDLTTATETTPGLFGDLIRGTDIYGAEIIPMNSVGHANPVFCYVIGEGVASLVDEKKKK